MEKKYEKPQILFEDIQMNASVAACDYVLVGSSGGYIESDQMGAYEDFGLVYTTESCTADPPICYHHPDDEAAFMICGLS